MSKKLKIVLIIALVLILVFTYCWFEIFHVPEYLARQDWNTICDKIDSGMVVSSVVENFTYQNSGRSEIDIENCLKPEDFDLFLGEIGPPTPNCIITIVFSDDTEVTIHNWDSPDFSVNPGAKCNYLIVNKELLNRIKSIFPSTNE